MEITTLGELMPGPHRSNGGNEHTQFTASQNRVALRCGHMPPCSAVQRMVKFGGTETSCERIHRIHDQCAGDVCERRVMGLKRGSYRIFYPDTAAYKLLIVILDHSGEVCHSLDCLASQFPQNMCPLPNSPRLAVN